MLVSHQASCPIYCTTISQCSWVFGVGTLRPRPCAMQALLRALYWFCIKWLLLHLIPNLMQSFCSTRLKMSTSVFFKFCLRDRYREEVLTLPGGNLLFVYRILLSLLCCNRSFWLMLMCCFIFERAMRVSKSSSLVSGAELLCTWSWKRLLYTSQL